MAIRTNNSDERRGWEESTPLDVSQRVLDGVHRPWGAAHKEEFDIVDGKRHNLQETRSGARKTLKNGVREEEVRGLWELRRQ